MNYNHKNTISVSGIICVVLFWICTSCSDYLKFNLQPKLEPSATLYSVTDYRITLRGSAEIESGVQIKESGFIISTGSNLEVIQRINSPFQISSGYAEYFFENFPYSTFFEAKFYVVTDAGESRSTAISFNTPSQPGTPKVLTGDTIKVGRDFISIKAVVLDSGYKPVIERGFCWSTTTNPTIFSAKMPAGLGLGSFSASITNLLPETDYYIRAYATNAVNTSYGEQKIVRTKNGYNLGDTAGGGIVFYLLKVGDKGYDPNKKHGLIATINDFPQAKWGCSGKKIDSLSVSQDSYYNGDFLLGKSHTLTICRNCNEPDIAARICNDLVQNGFSDWYLPSYYELEYMANACNDIYQSCYFRVSGAEYWTSDSPIGFQNSGTYANVLRVYPPYGAYIGQKLRSDYAIVRPIRSF